MISTKNITDTRKDFPILHQQVNGRPLVYLDNGASTQKPKAVIDALVDYYSTTNANVHRGVHTLSQRATDQFEASRLTVKDFVGASSIKEIIFTKGATESLNLVATCFAPFVQRGDNIIISAIEHHSNIVPWQLLVEKAGAELRVIPVLDNGQLDLNAYRNLLNARTKMVAVNHVSNALGTVNPIQEMASMAHAVGAAICVDGAQAAPHMAIDVQALDVDFYAFSGHKVYAPTGIGVLFGKEEWLERMPPYQGGGEMIKEVTLEKSTWADLPFKFEAGTPHIEGVIGLMAALKYVANIGLPAIAAHEDELLAYGTQKLTPIEGLRIIGTAPEKASVLSFVVDGTHPYDIGMILDKLGIAVRTGHHCAQPVMDRFNIPGTIRASFSFYNTKEEVELLADGVQRAVDMLR